MKRIIATAAVLTIVVSLCPAAHAIGLGGGVSGGAPIGDSVGGMPNRVERLDSLAKEREERRLKRSSKKLKGDARTSGDQAPANAATNRGPLALGPLSADDAVDEAEAEGGRAIGIRQIDTATGPIFRIKLLTNGTLRHVYINRAKPDANPPNPDVQPAQQDNP